MCTIIWGLWHLSIVPNVRHGSLSVPFATASPHGMKTIDPCVRNLISQLEVTWLVEK
jgi:hypothetical protein